jgi:hypothetical protein
MSFPLTPYSRTLDHWTFDRYVWSDTGEVVTIRANTERRAFDALRRGLDEGTFRVKPDQYVNVYSLERNYGGPEEGGWWYDSGDPVRSVKAYTDAEADSLVENFKQHYPSTGNRYSVLGGEDYGVYVEDHPAAAFPTERPRYE